MAQSTDDLPKYFKDQAGFCYVATEQLARAPDLTPWNGAVDAAGFAFEATPARDPAPTPAGAGLALPPLPAKPTRKK